MSPWIARAEPARGPPFIGNGRFEPARARWSGVCPPGCLRRYRGRRLRRSDRAPRVEPPLPFLTRRRGLRRLLALSRVPLLPSPCPSPVASALGVSLLCLSSPLFSAHLLGPTPDLPSLSARKECDEQCHARRGEPHGLQLDGFLGGGQRERSDRRRQDRVGPRDGVLGTDYKLQTPPLSPGLQLDPPKPSARSDLTVCQTCGSQGAAMANSAGVGGGAVFVPIFNIVLGEGGGLLSYTPFSPFALFNPSSPFSSSLSSAFAFFYLKLKSEGEPSVQTLSTQPLRARSW